MIAAVAALSSLPGRVGNFCYAPIHTISDKVRKCAEAVFGYIVRIVTFQLGAMNTPGARWIIRLYQRMNSDPRETRPFDLRRLQESKELLLALGGEETTLATPDGGAQIHCMLLKSEEVFSRLEKRGARVREIDYEGRRRRVLCNPPEILEKFCLPTVDAIIDGRREKAALLPETPPPDRMPRLIIPCHSPGRAWAMNRKEHLRNALAGLDVLAWDPRGTAESTGEPSEGGYYLDIETVCTYAFRQRYHADEIFLHGFCKGAACAAHAKKVFHREGIHAILSNPYTSFKEVVESYGWLGRLAARFGLKAIQSTDPAITGAVGQDYFDNVAKLSNLPPSEGRLIVIHTKTDDMMPYGTAEKIRRAFNYAGPFRELTHFHPDRKANGHMLPPDETEYVHREMYRMIYARNMSQV